MEEIMETKITGFKGRTKTPKRKDQVTLFIVGVPMTVHEKIKRWNLKMSAERGERVTLVKTYVEALKEFSKTL